MIRVVWLWSLPLCELVCAIFGWCARNAGNTGILDLGPVLAPDFGGVAEGAMYLCRYYGLSTGESSRLHGVSAD